MVARSACPDDTVQTLGQVELLAVEESSDDFERAQAMGCCIVGITHPAPPLYVLPQKMLGKTKLIEIWMGKLSAEQNVSCL